MTDHCFKLGVFFFFLFFRKPENLYDGIQLHLASTPPDSLMLGDECLVDENYTKAHEKREEALRALNRNVRVIVNKKNNFQDLTKTPASLRGTLSLI